MMKFANANLVAALRDYLRLLNVDPEMLLGREVLGNNAIPIKSWQWMLQTCSDYVRQPAFGLQFAKQIDVRKLGLVGYLAASCRTLGEALESALPYGQLVSEFNPTLLHIDNERIILSWPQQYGVNGLVSDEFGLGTTANVMRSMLGDSISPLRVDFADPAPSHCHIYEDYFRCDVRFNQSAPEIAFSSDCLRIAFASADIGLKQLLTECAADKLEKSEKFSGELALYQSQLELLINTGNIALDALAIHNHVSARQLQRRLKFLGISFHELLDITRRHLAEKYLVNNELDLSNVAQLLGYSEQSSFTRAFKTWTGTTPHQWRNAGRRK